MNEDSNRSLTADETRAFKSLFERGCELAQSPYSVDEAAWYFKNAICINPHDSQAHSELGRTYLTWWRCHEADEPLRVSMELNPCFPAFMNYGLNCNRIGLDQEAERAFENALQIAPDCAEAHFQLALALMTAFHDPTRMRKVVDYFRESLRLRPDHELSADFLGETLVLHLHAFEEARAFALEIEARFPDTAKRIQFIIQLNEPYYS
jgi:tetratricopeptide (TPR) repeat protein